MGAEPRALDSAGITWKGWGQTEANFRGLLESQGGRKGWVISSRVSPSIHLSLGQERNTPISITFMKGLQAPLLPSPTLVGALRLLALPSTPSLHNTQGPMYMSRLPDDS